MSSKDIQVCTYSTLYSLPAAVMDMHSSILIFAMHVMLTIAVAITFVNMNSAGSFKSNQELIDMLDSRDYISMCQAAMFAALPITTNYILHLLHKVYHCMRQNDIVTSAYVSKKLTMLTILLSLWLSLLSTNMLISGSVSTRLVYYMTFNATCFPSIVATALIAFMSSVVHFNVDLYLLPMYMLFCLSTVLKIFAARLYSLEESDQLLLLLSSTVSNVTVSGFAVIIVASFYRAWKKTPANISFIFGDVLTLLYTVLIYVGYAFNIIGHIYQNLLAPEANFLWKSTLPMLVVLIGYNTAFSSFDKSNLFSLEQDVKALWNKHDIDRLVNERILLEKQRNSLLLSQMLPMKCIETIQAGKCVEPELFKETSIFFSDIEGFTTMAHNNDPMAIFHMLNDLYVTMDHVSSLFPSLYKVETIGDAYVIAAGIPERNVNHAYDIADFAIICSRMMHLMINPLNGMPLKIRVGLHTGSTVGGIVGIKMPRYNLIGDTMNTASRMESTGKAGRIHMSEAMATILRASGRYEIEECGLIEVKNKGMMTTYFLIGATDLNQNVSEEKIQEILATTKELLSNGKIGRTNSSQWRHYSSCTDLTANNSCVQLSKLVKGNTSTDNIGTNGGDFSVSYVDTGSTDGENCGYTFLVVDDSLVIRKRHQRLLTKMFIGCTILVASDGASACKVLETVGYNNVDAILLDYNMPIMNGGEFISYIQEAGCDSCIIGIVGDRKHSVILLSELSVDVVLIKPVSVDILHKAILDNIKDYF